jgi:hypothetical protein
MGRKGVKYKQPDRGKSRCPVAGHLDMDVDPEYEFIWMEF